jgi:hypothetical protein
MVQAVTGAPRRGRSWRTRLLVAAPLAVGFALAAVAALPAVSPKDPPGLRGWPCGSVLVPNGAPTLQRVTADGVADDTLDFCGDALATRRWVTAGALLGGGVGSIGVWIVLRRNRSTASSQMGATTDHAPIALWPR